MSTSLAGKTLFITGASRGIGLAIAEKAAQEGANICIVAKTDTEDARLPGTIYSAAETIRKKGGCALPIKCDIRFEEEVAKAVTQVVETFGSIDICINNASAISLTATADTSMKRWDLMHQVNARGTFLCSRLTLPYLKKAANPHILNLSPPLNMQPKWFANHVAYTMAKYGMSMCTLGMAEEFRPFGIGVNSLWPVTVIATAAVQNLLGGDSSIRRARKPSIVADAAHWILTQPASTCSGNFFTDEEVLAKAGINNFDSYAMEPGQELMKDFFLE